MIDDSVPAADATVCTMLFSRIVELFTMLRMAMEITAAGIDDPKVRPTLSPRYTFAAVKMVVMSAPRTRPRAVSSLGFMGPDVRLRAAFALSHHRARGCPGLAGGAARGGARRRRGGPRGPARRWRRGAPAAHQDHPRGGGSAGLEAR